MSEQTSAGNIEVGSSHPAGADLVVYFRSRKRVSLRQCAIDCGFSHPHLGAIEKGKKSPSKEDINKIAKGLALSEVERMQLEAAFDSNSSIGLPFQTWSVEKLWEEIKKSHTCMIAAINLHELDDMSQKELLKNEGGMQHFQLFLSEPESFSAPNVEKGIQDTDEKSNVEVISVPKQQEGLCVPVRYILKGNRALFGAYGFLGEQGKVSTVFPFTASQTEEVYKNISLLDRIWQDARTNSIQGMTDPNRPHLVQ